MEILDSELVEIGREPTRDIYLEAADISRGHAVLRRSADGAWCVIDIGSKSGTFVNGVRLAPEAPMWLGDTATVEFGGAARFTFYAEDSPHQAMVRSLVVDVETGALQGARLEAEIHRFIRRGKQRLLAIFDIDRFSDVQEELGEVRAHELVGIFADELRAAVPVLGLRTGVLFRHGPDSLIYLFRSDDPGEPFEQTAARVDPLCANVG